MNKELIEIAHALVHAEGEQSELQAARALAAFFTRFTSGAEPAPDQRKAETVTAGGIAISPEGAVDCVSESLRTTRFIKGAYHALQQLLQRFPDQPINVLYAGCGPYATILLPALALLEPGRLNVFLIDISAYSIRAVKELSAKLGMEPYIAGAEVADAVTYRFPASLPLHLVVSETMFHALVREPQVAITINLAPQLTEGGLLIPEAIDISMAQSFFGKEPFYRLSSDEVLPETLRFPARTPAELLFTLDKNTRFSQPSDGAPCFVSSWYPVPEGFEDHPDLCLFTRVRISDNLVLGDASSTISNPYCINSIYNMKGYRRFRLIYRIGDNPSWELEHEKQP